MNEVDKHGSTALVRYVAAACILAGGSMHVVGGVLLISKGISPPVFVWLVFGAAVVLYPLAAAGLVKDAGFGPVLALCGPIVGGTLIFLGFFFPGSGLLMLIPGTVENEIRAIGFLTLVTEPVAVAASAWLLFIRRKGGTP